MIEDKGLWIDSALDIASEALSEGDTVAMVRVSRALLRYHAEAEQELAAARAVIAAARNIAPGIANNTQIHYSTIFAEAVEAYDKVRGKDQP